MISSYSERLEPVTPALQAVRLGTSMVYNHIYCKNLMMFCCHRQNTVERFKTILSKSEKLVGSCLLIYMFHRQCSLQAFRANIRASTIEECFRKLIFVPYLGWLISSLENRFLLKASSLSAFYPFIQNAWFTWAKKNTWTVLKMSKRCTMRGRRKDFSKEGKIMDFSRGNQKYFCRGGSGKSSF